MDSLTGLLWLSQLDLPCPLTAHASLASVHVLLSSTDSTVQVSPLVLLTWASCSPSLIPCSHPLLLPHQIPTP